VTPLKKRTYRFGWEFRRRYPAAKAFHAKQGRKS
jgi:hypothetical protein